MGRNVEELERALEDSVEDYLEFCRKHHREPEKPASGRFVVRLDPAVHRELMRVAARASKSLNTVVREAIERHLVSGGGGGRDEQRVRYELTGGRRAVAESTAPRHKGAAKKRSAMQARGSTTPSRRRRS